MQRRVRQRQLLHANVAELDADLHEWRALTAQRTRIAEAAALRGESWEQQAKRQKLDIDTRGQELHAKVSEYISKQRLQKGTSPWLREEPLAEVPDSWEAYVRVASVPRGDALRAVISESLSFPLTAAHAARIAGVTADPSSGCLSLLVLGAEMGAELSGLEKWAELLGSGDHGTKL